MITRFWSEGMDIPIPIGGRVAQIRVHNPAFPSTAALIVDGEWCMSPRTVECEEEEMHAVAG